MEHENKLSVVKSTKAMPSYVDIIDNEMEALTKVVQLFKKSRYSRAFERQVEVTDENGIKRLQIEVSEEDMLTCLFTGRMLNLNPVQSLAYGNALDEHAITKVEMGMRMALTTEQSLRLIHIFTNKENKSSIVISTNLIEGLLIKHGIKIEYVAMASKEYIYTSPTGVTEYARDTVEDEKGILRDGYIRFNPAMTQDQVSKFLASGKKIVVQKILNIFSTVKLTRGEVVQSCTVTVQDAIDWGFLPGVTSWGEVKEKGKPIWQARLERMLTKSALSICARRIANDILEGVYSPVELDDAFANYDLIENEPIEVSKDTLEVTIVDTLSAEDVEE